MKRDLHIPILGCLLGTAVGDAIGLPTEGMSRQRAGRFHHSLGHRLIFGHGMLSDDTEHTLMVATAWLCHPKDPVAFQKSLGWSLRGWMLALPAGVGLSTAKAILRLWIGFPAHRAGVRSAGNGAAMRSAILGVLFSDDEEQRTSFTLAACRLTHTDPRAEESALLVAEAAALAAHQADTADILQRLRPHIQSREMIERFAKLETALQHELSVADYAATIGCEKGVSGFAPNTVAVALYAWLRHRGDFKEVLTQVIACGGDTDTVAAIAGGICGAEVGEAGIPKPWINGLTDWPRSVPYIRRVAEALSQSLHGKSFQTPRLQTLMILPRNLLFLVIVLAHGFRRLLPPY
ncbi:MAG: ADP-ribosylglycohydrolase family protein [Prosthecobacter sp.]|nr:ADP-ribosylglycohydrolase family protein [Prosthecobacter sp.]